jgi:hypothetical protein
MTGYILIILLGIVLMASNIHAWVRGYFQGNLYTVRRSSTPFKFFYLLVLDLIGGAMLIVVGGILLIKELE